MGWHLKCVLCEKEEKHGLSCECYVKEAHRNALKMKGCTILESVLTNDQYVYIDLYQKLQTSSGEVIYMKSSVSDGPTEYANRRMIREIRKEEYEMSLEVLAKD